MQRYFVSKIESDSTVVFSKNDSYHMQKVMRMTLGSMIEVVVEKQLYICEIIFIGENQVIGHIVEEVFEKHELEYSVYLIQSLVKEQKMDLILQKCTELGVAGIYPYQAERSIVQLKGKEDKKLIRWKNIAREASEQSKREKIPFIGNVLTLDDLSSFENFDYKFICTVNETEKSLKKVLPNLSKNDTIIIVIGPEGGFSKREEEQFIASGFVPISLGKSVLRTETAGLFFLSVIRYIDME